MVNICTQILERGCRPKETHRHPSDVRCISSRLGRALPTHGCSRMLGRTCSTSVIQLSRTSSDTFDITDIYQHSKGETRAVSMRQCNRSCICQLSRGSMTTLAQAVWGVALENNITTTAKHLAGSANGRADGLSRLPPSYEWKMHPKLWTYLDKIWGPYTVDRFASILSAQLPRYNSLYLDPLSEGVDAFAQTNWRKENNFVNSPFRLLPKVVSTLISQQATATVIAPWWPIQPWFQKLVRMSIALPVKLPQVTQCMRKVGPLPEPLKNKHWKIYAYSFDSIGLVSKGNHSVSSAFSFINLVLI